MRKVLDISGKLCYNEKKSFLGWRMEECYPLKLTEQQLKLIDYCFSQCGESPVVFERDGEACVGSCPDLEIAKIISVLSEVYFDLPSSQTRFADLINDTIIHLNEICAQWIDDLPFSVD